MRVITLKKKKAPFKGKNPSKMGNFTIFLRCSKILGEAGSKKFLQLMFRKF